MIHAASLVLLHSIKLTQPLRNTHVQSVHKSFVQNAIYLCMKSCTIVQVVGVLAKNQSRFCLGKYSSSITFLEEELYNLIGDHVASMSMKRSYYLIFL